MTEDMESVEENDHLINSIRFYLGLYGIEIGTALFIRPACKMLGIKAVNSDQMWSILHRYDAERRHSRAGLLLIESFADYLSDSPLPPNCVNCDFSADNDDKSCICRHKDVKEEIIVKNFDLIPENCPIRPKKVCEFKEIVTGGNICRSDDPCEHQVFGDDTDPTFCMEGEIDK